MYKPAPEYKPPQEKFFEKALWPKISPGAYYRNFTVRCVGFREGFKCFYGNIY